MSLRHPTKPGALKRAVNAKNGHDAKLVLQSNGIGASVYKVHGRVLCAHG